MTSPKFMEAFIKDLAKITQQLHNTDPTIIVNELPKIFNGLALENLKFLQKNLLQLFVQETINLMLPPKPSTQGPVDLSIVHKILDKNTAFYQLINLISPEATKNLDHVRKQLFPEEVVEEYIAKELSSKTKNITWKYKKDNMDPHRFSIWTRGPQAELAKVDKDLKKIEHAFAKIKDSEEYSIQLQIRV